MRAPRLYKRPIRRTKVLRAVNELVEFSRARIYSEDLAEELKLKWARILVSALSSATASLRDSDLTELLQRVEALEKDVRK